MPRFEPRYLVGIEQIDHEHQRLFDIMAKVYASLGGGAAAAQTLTEQALAELLDYTATHFANEESLMAAAHYPELDAHRELHRRLLTQARDMAMRAEFGDPYVRIELSRFLYRWLIDHIETNDRKFGAFVAAGKAA